MLDDCAWDWKMRILKVINGKEIIEDEGGNISCNGLYIANIKDVDYMDKINKLCDTNIKPFNYYGSKKAETVVVAMGSVAGTIQEVVDYLNSKRYIEKKKMN